MLEQLRIQCPSCGIILDVRNSKHEAVKQISCPHCMKTLAVDFQEREQPKGAPVAIGCLYCGQMRIVLSEGINPLQLPDCEHVEVKVTRLSDGSCKCTIRVVDNEEAVAINDSPLAMDDEVVLAEGDMIQTGDTLLVFNRPGLSEPKTKKPAAHKPKPTPAPHRAVWIIAAVAMIIGISAMALLLWPSKKAVNIPPKPIDTTDTLVKKSELTTTAIKLEKDIHLSKGKGATDSKAYTNKQAGQLSDFELERQALSGNVDAQLTMGKRLVKQRGTSSIILGIKYLNMAAHGGSAEAQSMLHKIESSLQYKAALGDSISIYVLQSIN